MEKPIYLITDGGKLRSEKKLLFAVEQAFIAGASKIGFLQIREQVFAGAWEPASEEELQELIIPLKILCEKFKVKLIINSRADLASAHLLDGVHLGKNSSDIAGARALLGPDKLIGYSAHNESEVRESFEAGADYVFLSPIFKPLSKSTEASELGLRELKRICGIFPEKKIFALGGISKDNFVDCLKAGASGVSLISSILLASDPKLAASEFVYSKPHS